MPTSEKPKPPHKTHELFTWKDRQRSDAEFHEPILAEGDDDKAHKVSDKVAARLGLTEAEIAALRRGGK